METNQIVQLVGRHNNYLKNGLNDIKLRPYKVSYLIKTSQDEFIKILANETRKCILKEVDKAEMFSIIADTTSYVSPKDRLVVNLRYVNEEGLPVEKFSSMVEIKDKTGKGHAEKILDVLKIYQISFDNLVFQSYDCAKAMSGEFNGAQEKTFDFVGRTITYIPGQAHRINTFIEYACNSSAIFDDLFNSLESIIICFLHRKHEEICNSEGKIDEGKKFFGIEKSVKNRSFARTESIKAVHAEFEEIVDVLM